MKKRIEDITTLFVIVFTVIVSFILSATQAEQIELSDLPLCIFLLGYVGSILCIVIQFIILFKGTLCVKEKAQRIAILTIVVIGIAFCLVRFIKMFNDSSFSTDYQVYRFYNEFQYTMLGVIIIQRLVDKYLLND